MRPDPSQHSLRVPCPRPVVTKSSPTQIVRAAVTQGIFGAHLDTIAEMATPPAQQEPHPAGISVRWSAFYVWSQHIHFYKVLCWMLCLVLGGSDGLLPSKACALFRMDELLLASSPRCRLFFVGQCLPFALSKTRHLFVNVAIWCWPMRFLFYRVLTSHVETAMTTMCDMYACAAFLSDWLESTRHDMLLQLKLQQLGSGRLRVASWKRD